MNLLLTGATGYLGQRVAAALAAAGHRLSALVRPDSDTSVLAGHVPPERLFVVDAATLAPTLAQRKHDAVIHFAASYGRRGESWADVFSANCTFPVALLAAACQAKIPAFVNAGTSLPGHLGPYALSKHQFAEWGELVAGQGEIAFVELALEHFYGPDDSGDKFVTRVIRQCLHNEPSLPLTEGRQRRDFIHVDDVVAAVLTLVGQLPQQPSGYQRLEVGSGQAVSIRELVELIQRLTGADTRLEFGAVATRPGEPDQLQADVRALEALGWRCRIPLETGLRQTIVEERRKEEQV